MTKNPVIGFIAASAIGFVVVMLLAWLIRQIYFIINDLDNWALWVLNNPTVGAGFGIASGVIFLVVSRLTHRE